MSSSFESSTLNATLVAPAFASDGQPAAGQVPSLTSTNNFINFCLTYPNLPITNGTQVKGGSCNPAPMGQLPSVKNMPSVKIISPKYGDTVQPDTEFTISLAVSNMQTAIFVNSQSKYLAAPQQLNDQGFIIGNAVVVVEAIASFTDTLASNPGKFAFFKGLPDAPVNGALSTTVISLPAGVYRLSTELRASNHQPVVVSASRHGALGDVVYFTVGNGGEPPSAPDGGTVGNSIIPAAVNTQDSRQSSLTLDPGVNATGFTSTGQETAIQGLTSSLTSSNNFINFCSSTSLPLTNGTQVQTGSCNPVPMGVLPSVDLTPSSKFTNPKNGDNIPARQRFTVSLAVRNLQTGALTNPDKSYLAAPQQVNSQGLIIGHAKVVIEALSGFNQTTPTDPTKFAFFQSINTQAQGGILTATITDGLPDGYYRLSSMLSAANSQPVVMSVSIHGYAHDAVYFTVGDPSKATTSPGVTSSASPTNPTNPPSGQAVDKAAIIGGVLGGILGAIVICAAVFLVLRYRRQKRFLSDTEASRLPFASPFEEPMPDPYFRREKALPPGASETAGLSSSASLLTSAQIAESSRAAVSHSEILETSVPQPPPYRP